MSQFVFVYQRGEKKGGAVAVDDITIFPGSCYTDPPIGPDEHNGNWISSSTTSTEHLSY